MSTFLQVAGFTCLAFAFTLLARPGVRPSPAAYLWAIAVDTLCILFVFAVLIVWPAWWLLIPLTLWAGAMAVHILRLRDARVMARVLEANRPLIGGTERRAQKYETTYDYDGWPTGDADARHHRP
ncbi:hypothetical protein ACFV42_23275 [Streptomyces solisilvae]|uniref:hypothetical protein n=1 Tax=Streptomyces malaysiensis TaxID=92644 RepID=UPI003682880E